MTVHFFEFALSRFGCLDPFHLTDYQGVPRTKEDDTLRKPPTTNSRDKAQTFAHESDSSLVK